MAPYIKLFGTVIGKKHVQAIPYWLPSLAAYFASAVVAIPWVCDLNVVMKKVPFYKDGLMFPYEDDKRIFIHPRPDEA